MAIRSTHFAWNAGAGKDPQCTVFRAQPFVLAMSFLTEN
jgi:hypothetical protein